MRGVLKGAFRSLSVPKAPFRGISHVSNAPFATPGLRRPAETTLPTPCRDRVGAAYPTTCVGVDQEAAGRARRRTTCRPNDHVPLRGQRGTLPTKPFGPRGGPFGLRG